MNQSPKADPGADQVNQPGHDQEFWAGQWVASRESGIEPPDAPTWFNERDKMVMDVIRPYLPAHGTLAELGCGSGRTLARISLERPDLTFVAVDYEEEALKLVQASARAYGAKIQTHLDDVNNLKFADASFEMVLSGGLLEHFVDPKQPLREMVRVLKPGGSSSRPSSRVSGSRCTARCTESWGPRSTARNTTGPPTPAGWGNWAWSTSAP